MTTILPPKEFAEEVALRLVEPSRAGSWFLDRREFALVLKDELGRPQQTVRLTSFYNWYKETVSLDLVIQRIVALTRGHADTTDYNVVSPFIFPKVFDRSVIHLTDQTAKRDYGEKAPPILSYVVGDVFSIIPVIDTGMTQEMVTGNHLTEWGKSFTEVFDNSYRNLVGISEGLQFDSISDPSTNTRAIYESLCHDGYDSSRLLIDELINGFIVGGEKLVSIPTTSQLVIVGSNQIVGLAKMLTNLEAAREKDQSLPPFVLLFRDGKWSNYSPSKQSGEYSLLNRLQTEYWSKGLQTTKRHSGCANLQPFRGATHRKLHCGEYKRQTSEQLLHLD